MVHTRFSAGGRHHLQVRAGVIGLLTTATAALIGTQPWHADGPQRFVAVSVILLVVLAVQLVAVLRLTGRRARVAAPTLVAGAGSAVAVTAAWILPRLSGFPDASASAMVGIEAGGLVAAGLAGFCTRDVGQAALACLWSTALGFFLVFAGTLLTFTFVASSVPDTQGRAMLPTATLAQRLAENRIEAPDGYLILLALSMVLSLAVCVVVPTTPRAAVGRPSGLSRTRGPRGPSGRGSASGVRRR
jgi:hypothetical protein